MNELKTELAKESYSALTDAEALALLPEPVMQVGRIQNDDKLDLLTLVIKGNLTERLTEAKNKTDAELLASHTFDAAMSAQYKEVARVLLEAFTPSYILSDVYRINLGLADIRALFDGGVAFGLITPTENDTLIALATYTNDFDFSIYSEADVAQARFEMNATGETQGQVWYYLPNSTQTHHTRGNKFKTNIDIALDGDAVAYDTKFKVYVSVPSTVTGEYVENPNPITTSGLVLVAGKKEVPLVLTQNYGRHTRYRIVSDRVDAFTAVVTSVAKYA